MGVILAILMDTKVTDDWHPHHALGFKILVSTGTSHKTREGLLCGGIKIIGDLRLNWNVL